MSNQDRLLSDEDTRKEIASIIGLEEAPDGTPYNIVTYNEWGEPLEAVDYSQELEELALFFNTQKRLYAESFIGEDFATAEYRPDSVTWGDTNYSHNAVQYGRNELRAEQRARIK